MQQSVKGSHYRPRHLDALTILVQVWEVDFITEEDDPLAQLYGGHDHSIGGATILTVVVKRLQEKLWRGSTGKVESNNL